LLAPRGAIFLELKECDLEEELTCLTGTNQLVVQLLLSRQHQPRYYWLGPEDLATEWIL
jgi:hypothetical protein